MWSGLALKLCRMHSSYWQHGFFPPFMATGRHMQSYCNAQSRCQLDSLPFMHCSSPYTNQIAIWKLFVNHCWCLCHFETACQGVCYTAFQSGVDEKSCCGRKRLWHKKQPEKVWTGFQTPVLCRPPLPVAEKNFNKRLTFTAKLFMLCQLMPTYT